MKLLSALFFVFCLVFSLNACSRNNGAETETTVPSQGSEESMVSSPSIQACPLAPVEPTAADAEASQDIPVPVEALVAVSLTPQAQTTSSQEGTEVFVYSYQDVFIHMPDFPDTATAIRNYFLERSAEADLAAGEFHRIAQQDYQQVDGTWTPYTFDLKYTPTRLDSKLLSFFEERISFLGEAGRETSLASVTFSGEDGSILKLRDMVTSDEMADALCTMVLDTLEKRNHSSESVYFENYTDIVQLEFEHNGEETDNWYLTDTGMVFYFSPGVIADRGIGPVEVEFTYGQLRGILIEDLMPKVPPQCSTFSFNAARKEQIQLGDFDQVMTVTCDAKGQGVALFAGATLYDVSVQQGHWTPINKFQDNNVLFAANRLTEKDLLLIYTYIPDAMPNLRLTANCGDGEERTYYIFQSGKDGSILLIDQA